MIPQRPVETALCRVGEGPAARRNNERRHRVTHLAIDTVSPHGRAVGGDTYATLLAIVNRTERVLSVPGQTTEEMSYAPVTTN